MIKLDRLKINWKRGLKGFHKFWVFEIDPFIFGLYRIYLGIFFIFYYIRLAPSWLMLYGPAGISPLSKLPLSQYQIFDSLFRYINTEWVMVLLYIVSLIFAFALTFGILGKIPLIWLWVMNFSMMYMGLYIVTSGEEQILAVLMFYSLFFPLNSSLAWRRKSKRKKAPDSNKKVTVWALRALQIQFALIYALSFHIKLGSDVSWRDGTVVYYAMMAMTYARWPGAELFSFGNAIFSRLATYYTLLVESLFPLLVWWRPLRVWLVLAAIFLHVNLAIFLEGLDVFNWVMIAGLILFLPSRRTRIWFRQTFKKTGSLVYDGSCGLCRKSIKLIKVLDPSHRLNYIDMRNRAAMKGLTKVDRQQAEQEIHLVDDRGNIRKGFFVYRALAKTLPLMYPMLILLYFPGSRFLGPVIYKLIASNRYNLSTNVCHSCKID